MIYKGLYRNPTDYTVQRILQTRIQEWAAFPFSRGSSQPRDQTQVSHIAGGFFTRWATRKPRTEERGWNTLSLANPGCRLSGEQKEAPAQGKQGLALQSTARLCATVHRARHPLLLCLWLISSSQGSTVSSAGGLKEWVFYVQGSIW